MTKEKMIEALDRYSINIKKVIKFNPNQKFYEKYNHISEMIPKIKTFLNENNTEKANRWLGFIQGVLWMDEWYTLDELKDHNKEEEPKPITVNGRTYPKEIFVKSVEKHNEPDPLFLYPNKFKVIRGLHEVDGDGIYYVNENIEDELIEPFTNWIADIYKNEELIPGGFVRESILLSEFCKKYDKNNNFGIQSYGRDMCMAKTEYYYQNDLNPIRFFKTPDGINMALWGQVVKFLSHYEKTELGLKLYENNTISNITMLMNLLNNLLIMNPEFSIMGDNDGYIKQYLYKLKCLRHIYEGELLDHFIHIKMIVPSGWIVIDINNLDSIYHDLQLLKNLVIK